MKLFKNPYFYLGTSLIIGGVVTYVVLAERKKKREEVDKILDILGTGRGATGTLQDQNYSGGAFDSKLYTMPVCKGKATIRHNEAVAWAKEIYDAKGYIYDSEDIVLNVFRRLQNKCDSSYLSKVFFDMYKRDLLQYLDFVDRGNNRQSLNAIVNNLR